MGIDEGPRNGDSDTSEDDVGDNWPGVNRLRESRAVGVSGTVDEDDADNSSARAAASF